MIAIIDYDAGNLKSVEKALAHIGEESVITRDFQTILNADKVILPGVGAFGDAMANLKRLELDKVIRELNEKQTPFWESVWGYSCFLRAVRKAQERKVLVC